MALDLSRRQFLQASATVLGSPLAFQDATTQPSSQPDTPNFIPMPGRITETAALLHVTGDAASDASIATRVRWGRDVDELRANPRFSQELEASGAPLRLEFPLDGLAQTSEVFYEIECTNGGVWRPSGATGRFRTQKKPGQTYDFCVLTDGHWGDTKLLPTNGPRRWTGERCLEFIPRHGDYDFALDLGDSPHLTSITSQPEAFSRYFAYRKLMSPITRAMPVFLALGNHEQEAGFYQHGSDAKKGHVSNMLRGDLYQQMFATTARHYFIPNPRGDTYPQGGEGANGFDSIKDWMGQRGPWNASGPKTHLGNFYAWTWGDALFVVLDPFRYTLPGSLTVPTKVNDWTLGPTQTRWLEKTLAESTARWKFVCCHHLVGGAPINVMGDRIIDGAPDHSYSRGSGLEALRAAAEQSQIHRLMLKHGVQFFLYGHDHTFCHAVVDKINYVCCGRPTHLNAWLSHDGMRDSYGDLLSSTPRPGVKALRNVLGFTSFRVSPEQVSMRWVRTGRSFQNDVCSIDKARRDWLECWAGRRREVREGAVSLEYPPWIIDGVYSVKGARVPAFGEPPVGPSLFQQLSPSAKPALELPGLAEPEVAVDCLPEVVYEYTQTA